MTVFPMAGVPQSGRPPRSRTAGYRRGQQASTSVRELEVELKRIDQEIQGFGSFEGTPDDLLHRFAELLHERTLAQARDEGMA